MTDGDAGDPVELVAARLRELGLDHPAIDPTATAADLADRIAASASLDALVAGRGGSDPTAFHPNWPPQPASADPAGTEPPN